MKRNNPTRVVETGRVVRGSSGQGIGWLQSLAERARNIAAQIEGVRDRLNTPFADGVPSMVGGERVFKADTTKVYTITNFSTDPDRTPNALGNYLALKVNPIIMAGETYRVPIIFTPPGVLYARHLVVSVEAGFLNFANTSRPGIMPLNDYRQAVNTAGQAFGMVPNNPTVFALQYTYQQQVLGNFTNVMPFLPFLWNIIDEKSGRQYAQDWMPSGALLNTRTNALGALTAPLDTELFEFDMPWLFERDAQVAFLFRPIMDLYQIDATDTQFPWVTEAGRTHSIDDLNGGRRDQQAAIVVEFHGNRYYSAQDALKDGARV